jgi:membrane protease YdiL (CAAX protease family)
MVSMMVRSRAVSNITTVAAAAASLWCFLVSCGSLSLSSVHAFSTTTPLRCSPCTHIRRHGLGFFSSSQRRIQHQPQSRSFHNYCPLTLESSNSDAERSDASDDKLFDAKTTIALVGGQSLLIGAAAIAAKFVGTPNYGLGPGIDASLPYVLQGLLWSLPLGLLAIALDLVEDKFPALQEVTKATQSSVLSLLGGTFKPVLGIATALALGAAAGIGEEMLFRGVLQFELGSRLGSEILAVGLTSIVFGALHAVTPLYAGLAALASVYFGWLYLVTGNLVVPIVTHAFYDWAALLYAHWTVANMSDSEQQSLLEWRFGGSSSGSNGGEGEE